MFQYGEMLARLHERNLLSCLRASVAVTRRVYKDPPYVRSLLGELRGRCVNRRRRERNRVRLKPDTTYGTDKTELRNYGWKPTLRHSGAGSKILPFVITR